MVEYLYIKTYAIGSTLMLKQGKLEKKRFKML